MQVQAVITADIVNSTRLLPEKEAQLLAGLKEILAPFLHEFYRGDSFQAYLPDAAVSLNIALQCRATAIAMQEETAIPDLRISIGLGATQEPVTTIGSAKGEAFLLSGRRFDEIQPTETRLAIATTHEWAALGLQLAAAYIDAIFSNMSAKQAEVILQLLQGDNQQKVAERTGKSKSTISQFASAGKWSETEKVMEIFNKIVHKLNETPQ